jgi:hypothetical protein
LAERYEEFDLGGYPVVGSFVASKEGAPKDIEIEQYGPWGAFNKLRFPNGLTLCRAQFEAGSLKIEE